MIVKVFKPNLRQGQIGGNRRPLSFKHCEQCKELFGPLDRLKRRFCSKKCWYQAKLGRKVFYKRTKLAVAAHSAIAYEIKKGNIIRPQKCEQCQIECKPEAAHYDYRQKLKVRWLCQSCHRKWDYSQPKKGVTRIVLKQAIYG